MFDSQFGFFTADGREYVTTRVDTPRPWLNFLTNDDYGICVSQNGFGYSFYRAAMDVRVSYIDIFGYVPTHPQTGKFVYLHDATSKKSWSLTPMSPDDPHTDFRCRHGLGYQIISAENEGITAELAFFVPRQDPVEMWEIRLRNDTRRTRKLRFFPYVELSMHCASSMTDVLTYTRGGYEKKLGAAMMRMTNSTSPFMYDAFMCGDYAAKGHDCRRESFLGTGRTIRNPRAAQAGKCTGSSVSAEQMCLVVGGEMNLKPGEEKVAHVVMGVSHRDADVRRFKKKYTARGAWERELAKVQKYWNRVLENPKIETPSPLLDLQMNTWAKYQSYFTSRWVRGGDKGYRDVLQDIMGYNAIEPEWCAHWLLESLGNMFSSGLCPRQYSHYGAGDDLRLHRDSPMWIPLVVDQYVRETGDFKFLKKRLPYRDKGSGTVWDHVMRGLGRLWSERGKNGLCMIGDGDWNDSLDEVALEGRGQTAWLTIATIYAMRVARGIAGAAGFKKDASTLSRRIKELDRVVNRSAWDGDWYLYAIGDHGEKIGSRKNRYGKIHLNCQTWAIFAQVARGKRLEKVLRTIDRRMDTRYGPLLMDSAYTRYTPGIGKVSAKNPGMAENAPMYMHGAAFKIMGDCMLGRGDHALDTYERVLPQSRHNTPEHHGGEPFASHRYLVGPGCPERFGQSAYPWFCGWQAWTMVIGHQWIAGVRPGYHELLIDPCIPAKWKRLTVRRKWRGATYEIEIRNPKRVSSGLVELYLDGERIEGNSIPAPRRRGERHRILAIMGPGGTRPELL